VSLRIIAALWVLLLAHCASSEPREVSRSRSQRALDNVRRDLARAPRGLQEATRSDGIHVVRVEQGFRHATIVTRAADGSRTARCVSEAREAEAMLRGADE
jgi:hypothetical protein